MKILIVEDDFVCRRLLQEILNKFGKCDIAVNGIEAVESFKLAWKDKKPYDLVCLDIMLPDIDGQEVLKQIRECEYEQGVGGLDGVKIIMTTALGDSENIKKAFREQCEAYVVKPIDKTKLVNTLKKLELIKSD